MGSDNMSENYFGSNMPFCSSEDVIAYIYNITSPYTDDTNNKSIVGTSVAMFTLSVLFFNLTMFRQIGFSIRVARSTALSLFLPVMSYLFSEAKNAAGTSVAAAIVSEDPSELPLRARLILTWMILVELLRKKTQALWVPKMGYSGNAEQAARIVWLGSLVFSNIRSPGRRALFGVFWAVAAAKMVQRLAMTLAIRCSFAAARNPEIIGAYTQPALKRSAGNHGRPTWCEFAVMGEEKIEMKTGPGGYVVSTRHDGNLDGVLTVGKIRGRADELPQEAVNLCLSLALHKLLRRRLEGPPSRDGDNDMETQACRDLVDDENLDAKELFRVAGDETTFLRDCYQSVDPVVLASPFFLVANYILFPVAVGGVCLLTVVASGYGDVVATFYSIRTDNYVMSLGIAKTVVCLMRKVLFSPPANLAAVDLCITFFLFVAYCYEEVCELFVLLFSNWFLVSLVCSYVKAENRSRYHRRVIASSIRCILYVRTRLTERERLVQLKQLDLAKTALPRMMPMELQQGSPLPATAKVSIVKYLRNCIRNGGKVTLDNNSMAWQQYTGHQSSSTYMVDEGIAKVILTWYIATSLLEVNHPRPDGEADDDRSTAITLSRYCGYLVAFRPELLPNDWNDTQDVYKTMVRDLRERLGFWGYCFFPNGARVDNQNWPSVSTSTQRMGSDTGTKEERVVEKGFALARSLESAMSREEPPIDIWKVLAELWVQLVVYIAPASEGAHLQAHCNALVEGGEFITVVWALATHSGITRPDVMSTAGA